MAAPRMMSGGRAKVGLFDPLTGTTKFVGLFSNCSYGVTYEVAPAYVLGSFLALEVDYMSVDIVQVTCTGFRVVGAGWHKEAMLPRVQDLLLHEYLELIVVDRQQEALGGEPRIAKIRNVRPTSGSGGFAARQPSEITVTYVGILTEDESTVNAEHPTASVFP